MEEFITQNWLYLAIGLFVILLVIWWLRAGRDSAKTGVPDDNAVQDPAADGELLPDETPLPDDVSASATPEPVARPEPATFTAPTADTGTDGMPNVPAATGDPDDLRQIKGLGPKLAKRLTELGITRYDQIAAWGPAEIAEVDQYLGTFQGRIERDSWVEQAGYLAKGDIDGFKARYGAL
ncbi:hypothetical protein [Sphingorhabdus sp. Alg239-R122]|uniref:hypothetical protein n=1 Tax=Sphingorhabdus sp. Alg239-R122 TaxID=2305989 RepID=UPI0013DBC964|nr:hypothetical protein [Sphingorhabdus sp. Alg239-R122]